MADSLIVVSPLSETDGQSKSLGVQKFRKTPKKYTQITTGLSENLPLVSSEHKSLRHSRFDLETTILLKSQFVREA